MEWVLLQILCPFLTNHESVLALLIIYHEALGGGLLDHILELLWLHRCHHSIEELFWNMFDNHVYLRKILTDLSILKSKLHQSLQSQFLVTGHMEELHICLLQDLLATLHYGFKKLQPCELYRRKKQTHY